MIERNIQEKYREKMNRKKEERKYCRCRLLSIVALLIIVVIVMFDFDMHFFESDNPVKINNFL